MADTRSPEIEITPEMIEAGERELLSFSRKFEDDADAVIRIYQAMRPLERVHKKRLNTSPEGAES